MRWRCSNVAFASSQRVALTLLVSLSAGLSACAHSPLPSTELRFADSADPLVSEGFGACASDQPESISLDSDEPLVVIVHGCLSSGHEFKKLSEVFEFHGQQSICFNYDHRRTLRGTAVRLRRGLDALRARIPNRQITLLGHSQGGLVSRIALAELDDVVNTEQHDLRLVTVSSPFSGIHASRHCGLPWLHVMSLGITLAVCQGIAGANWVEIHPRSRYWTEPSVLDPGVYQHVQIITEEEGTCRVRDEDGECSEDDLVFTTDEQDNAIMSEDPRVEVARIHAGHAQVVGGGGVEPAALIAVLQEFNVLAPTEPARAGELVTLIRALFDEPEQAPAPRFSRATE